LLKRRADSLYLLDKRPDSLYLVDRRADSLYLLDRRADSLYVPRMEPRVEAARLLTLYKRRGIQLT
jgi:hypothetical protein